MGWLEMERSDIPFVAFPLMAPSPLLDPLCLAALKTGIPFVGPPTVALTLTCETKQATQKQRGGAKQREGHHCKAPVTLSDPVLPHAIPAKPAEKRTGGRCAVQPCPALRIAATLSLDKPSQPFIK